MTTECVRRGDRDPMRDPNGDGVPPITDEEILSLWRIVRPSVKQDRAMVYQSGPYDVDHPTAELRKLVELASGLRM